MKKVYKYKFEIKDRFELELPYSAEILLFQAQKDIPTLWVLVNPELTTIMKRKFCLVGTGHAIEDYRSVKNYIGTAQFYESELVFHLFEVWP